MSKCDIIVETQPGDEPVWVGYIGDEGTVKIATRGHVVEIPAHQVGVVIEELLDIYNNLPKIINGRAVRDIARGESV